MQHNTTIFHAMILFGLKNSINIIPHHFFFLLNVQNASMQFVHCRLSGATLAKYIYTYVSKNNTLLLLPSLPCKF